MKIASPRGIFKNTSYWLLIAVLAFSIDLTNLNQSQAENVVQKTPEVTSSLVNQDKEKNLTEIKKEFHEQNKDTLISPLSVFSNLVTLILIMLALAWLYNTYGKKLLSKALSTKNANKNFIDIVSTVSIGQNKYLHIVEIGEERILIGATNANVSLIKSLKNNIPKEKVVSDE